MVVAPAGTHLVGSVCLNSAEEVFTTISKALDTYISRIPDGETGNRINWVDFQVKTFDHVKRLQRTADGGYDHSKEPQIPDAEATKMIGDLHPGYSDLAIESYQIFAQLKQEGKIPKYVKFQVSIPTPVAGVQRGVDSRYAHLAERPYEEGIYRDLRKIQDTIPHTELAIQWDVAAEIMIMEGVYLRLEDLHGPHAAFGYTGPWWEDIKQGCLDRLVRNGSHGHVDNDVDMGYHLCYGDYAHKHFVEPQDAALLVEVSRELLTKIDRKVDFIHMPVPKDKLGPTYYEPLKDVAGLFQEKGTILYLGLVHGNDREGTETRVEIADKVLGKGIHWGVATECGIGRTPKDELSSILETSKIMSSPVV